MQEAISYTDCLPTRDFEMDVCSVIGSGECMEICSKVVIRPTQEICYMVRVDVP